MLNPLMIRRIRCALAIAPGPPRRLAGVRAGGFWFVVGRFPAAVPHTGGASCSADQSSRLYPQCFCCRADRISGMGRGAPVGCIAPKVQWQADIQEISRPGGGLKGGAGVVKESPEAKC